MTQGPACRGRRRRVALAALTRAVRRQGPQGIAHLGQDGLGPAAAVGVFEGHRSSLQKKGPGGVEGSCSCRDAAPAGQHHPPRP